MLTNYERIYEEFYRILRSEVQYADIEKNLMLQHKFRDGTLKTCYKIRGLKKGKEEQKKLLHELIGEGCENDLTNLNNGEGIPLPANAEVILLSCRVEKSKPFTSANKPLLLPFYFRYAHKTE